MHNKKPSKYYGYYKKASQAGRSMIEMLGVVALIGVLSGGVYGLSGVVRSKSQMTQAFMETQAIVDKTHTLYSWRPNYRKMKETSPDIQTYLVNQKVLVPMTLNTDRAKTAIGKGLTIVAEQLTNTGSACSAVPCKEVFTITIYGLAKQQCMEFAMFDWGEDIFKIAAGETFFLKDDLPLKPPAAVSLCNSTPEAFSLSFL